MHNVKRPGIRFQNQECLFEPFYLKSGDAREYVRKEMDEAARLWGVK